MADNPGPITSIEEPGVKAQGELLHEMRREVAQLLERNQTGFPGAQPVSFSRQHIQELLREDYFVCEKSDGMRYLLYATHDESGAEAHYLIDRKNDFWFLTNRSLHLPQPGAPQDFHTKTLVDGELVWDSLPNGDREPRFLIFDCLVMDGLRLVERTLDKRLAYIKARLYEPYVQLFKEYPGELKFQPFHVEMKPFQFSYGILKMFKEILPALKHGNDGLIFTCRTSPYKHGTDPHIVKWKPPEENTIDFKLKLHFPLVEPDDTEKVDGALEPFVDYDSVPRAELLVWLGNNKVPAERYKSFHDAYISEEEWEELKALDDPINDRIVECTVDEQGRWRIVRFRDDKSDANHQTTVDSVLDSIRDRVSEDDLVAAANSIRDAWKARGEREKRRQG
ncbi:mRNA capping enzyme, alpha subunit [Sarocladium strictum]